MTRERDIERVLDAWFEPGPTEMPDRLFDDVLARVDRLPQRRIPLTLRFPAMDSRIRWLALAAAALVVVVGGLALIKPPDANVGTSPTPSPTESSTPSGPLGVTPAALQHRFIGPLRSVEGLPDGPISHVVVSGRILVYDNGTGGLLRSQAGVEGDELILRNDAPNIGCEAGNEGRYPFSISPGGSILTIQAGSDDCAARLAAVPGTWQRSDCRISERRCLGIVEAGTYLSQYFNPAAATHEAAVPDFGALTYTVPDGWANEGDEGSLYGLMRAASYAAGGQNTGPNPPDNLTLLARPMAAALHAGCPDGVPETGVGSDRSALTAWLLAHPGLVKTQQADITIDGMTATVLDVEVTPDWSETCDSVNPFIAAPLFVGGVGGYHWAIAQDDRMRIILLDLPAGTTVAIFIDPQDPTTFDGFIGEAMPIVESFDFR
ncbi:MAG TPA: hypothetical protein VFC71_03720 [Candidatus Polarisedimenticolia bacterium]|nr:hypothetical protein [Candidatus Polarisedimenticolia bacterium]